MNLVLNLVALLACVVLLLRNRSDPMVGFVMIPMGVFAAGVWAAAAGVLRRRHGALVATSLFTGFWVGVAVLQGAESLDGGHWRLLVRGLGAVAGALSCVLFHRCVSPLVRRGSAPN